MRIGLCGGTFDPFHRGHLDPVLAARALMQWDRVLYIPAWRQPFKQDRETASGHHRFAMAAIATLDHDGMLVSDLELQRATVSYTVDTLEQLRDEYPDAVLDWIIGDDNLGQLLEWKSVDRLFDLANFAVLTRSGSRAVPAPLQPFVTDAQSRTTQGAIVFAENATVPVSSTEIRERIRSGEPVDHLVDPRVSRYIHHYGLYRKGQS